MQAEAGAAHRIDNPCVLEVVRQVTQALAAPARIGLVLTDRPAVALCLANRRASIRAAWGVSAASVRAATEQIGANLLVVNPAEHGFSELRGMIREFLLPGMVLGIGYIVYGFIAPRFVAAPAAERTS